MTWNLLSHTAYQREPIEPIERVLSPFQLYFTFLIRIKEFRLDLSYLPVKTLTRA